MLNLTKSRCLCIKSTDNVDFILGTDVNMCYLKSCTYLEPSIKDQAQQYLNTESISSSLHHN